MSKIDLVNQASAPSTPSAGETSIYIDQVTKKLKSKDDSGAITDYGAASAGISQLTGEVTATGPGVVPGTLLNSAVIGKVLTGLTPSAGTIVADDSILQAFGKLVNKQNSGFYPKALDGDVVIAADTTMTRDMYYNNLTVNNGATLFTGGFRIFAQSIVVNGVIDRSGPDASGTGATSGLAAGTTSAGSAGGAGGTLAGSAGGASATALGGSAGAGGLGSSGAGGAAGTLTLNTLANGGIENFWISDRAREARNIAGTQITGGAGAGGGGGDGTAGGAGGAGGGVLVLCARSITGTGTLRARGGNGFQPVAGNRGGGGGGGGGVILTVSENDVTATSLVQNVSGGVGASGSGTGVSGLNGSNGRIYNVIA